MEVLRLPPYPLSTTWDVPSANTSYTVYVEDLIDHSSETSTVISNAQSKLIYSIPQSKAQFDREFLFRVSDSLGNVVVDSNLDILRPYYDYRTLGNTATEISEYKMYELIARSLIDSIVEDGFYNNKHVIEAVGNGADYYPLFKQANKVLKVYRNNVLVYDSALTENAEVYTVSLDHSSIIRVIEGEQNRRNFGSVYLFSGSDDFGPALYPLGTFAPGDDFIFVLDTGYKAVPAEVEYATKMLIEDIKCGKLEYYKRYVTSYSTDQFRVQLDKSALDGTGNILVDKILSKYTRNISRPGVL
jgi:hypothetical protein